jgi:hypothetical protein
MSFSLSSSGLSSEAAITMLILSRYKLADKAGKHIPISMLMNQVQATSGRGAVGRVEGRVLNLVTCF